MVRVEQSNPMAIINTHNLIANDPKLAPRYLVAQEQVATHLEDMFIFLGDDNQQACQRRWNTLPYSLKVRIPFSCQNERDTK